MATYKSDVITLQAPAAKVFAKLSNLEGLKDLLDKVPAERLPEEQRSLMENLSITPDTISIPGGPVGAITLRKARCENPSLIELKGENSPVPLSLSLHVREVSETSSEAYAEIDIDIPIFLKPMIAKPMQQMISQFGNILGAINFE